MLTFLCVWLLGCLGCTQPDVFKPKELPDAILMQPYYQEIMIGFHPGPIYTFKYSIQPENSGLELHTIEHDYYNHLKIEGTPKKAQDITLYIWAGTSGAGFETGREIEKTYIIKVKSSE